MGLQIGAGDQDNYLKLTVNANGGAGGVRLLQEVGGLVTADQQFGAAEIGNDVLASTAGVVLSLAVDPLALTARALVQVDGGPVVELGTPVGVPAAWFDPADVNGLAVGVISTSANSIPFNARWSYLDVIPLPAVPVADFSADKQSVVEGGSVSFTDVSSNGPTEWLWSFEGGTPAASTDQNPVVVYETPGTYAVTLTASNASGSDVETKATFITVTPAPSVCRSGVVEAEAGVLSGSVVASSSLLASGGVVVGAPDGSGDSSNPSVSVGSVALCFDVTVAGKYVIAAVQGSPNGGSDSWWVRVNDGPAFLWDSLLTGGSLVSDLVNNRGVADPVVLDLGVGQHNVRFDVSEDGAVLDTVELQPAPPPPSTLGLRVSSSSDRSGSKLLSGATVSDDVFVFTSPDSGVASVKFFIDNPSASGSPYRTEKAAPFDLAGGSVSVAKPFDTATLSDGQHSMTAVVTMTAGGTQQLSATFTVNNASRLLVANPTTASMVSQVGGSKCVSECDVDDIGWISGVVLCVGQRIMVVGDAGDGIDTDFVDIVGESGWARRRHLQRDRYRHVASRDDGDSASDVRGQTRGAPFVDVGLEGEFVVGSFWVEAVVGCDGE